MFFLCQLLCHLCSRQVMAFDMPSTIDHDYPFTHLGPHIFDIVTHTHLLFTNHRGARTITLLIQSHSIERFPATRSLLEKAPARDVE